MLRKALRAARLDRSVYHEVRDQPESVLQVLGIVALVAIAIGSGLMDVLGQVGDVSLSGSSFVDRLFGMWLAVVTVVMGWVLWAGVVYVLGSKFLGGGASFNQNLRALGIGYGPAVLLILSPLPVVGDPARAVGTLWVLVTGVVAVHETGDVDWLGAFLAAFLGWVLFFVLLPASILEPSLAR